MTILTQRFIVDEAGFKFSKEDSDALEATLLRFLALLEYAQGTGQRIVRWSELWHVAACSGRTLAETLYGSADVERDIRLLVGGRLDKILCWDEEDPSLNPPVTVRCGAIDVDLAPGIGLAAEAYNAGFGAACLTTDQAEHRGAVLVTVPPSDAQATVYFLVGADDGPSFWRSTVVLEDMSPAAVGALASLAFPGLTFATGIWAQVGRFQGAFRDLRQQIVRDLSGLADNAVEVWQSFVEPARIAAEMAGRAGVDCSPDSPGTHANAAAMAERRVECGGQVITCEWHTKLEPHRNRIHFAVMGDRVYVGMFAEHLTT